MQRFKCNGCRRTFNERTGTALAGLKTPPREVEKVLKALDEGMGFLGVERTFKHGEATVLKWLLRAGEHAKRVLETVLRGINAAFVQFDELKTWYGRKKRELWFWKSLECKNKVWLALHDSDTRTEDDCRSFLRKTARTLEKAPRGASSDCLQLYGAQIPKRWKTTPYAQIVKHYEGKRLVSVERKQVCKHSVASVEDVLAASHLGTSLNTAFVERLNATNRAAPARFHRKTLHYSKNRSAAVAAMTVRQAAYNLIRTQGRRQGGRHETPLTPCQKAGLTHRPWTWLDLLTHQPTTQ